MVPGKERTTGSHVALMQGSPWASNSWQFAHSCRALSDRKADWICALLLVFIWVLAALLVNPVGDFPLNDDWAYGFAVRSLVETGHLRLSGWTATNLIAQVPWGALFCLPFGFSFTALRLSTLVLGLIGVLATYGLLREARASAWLALFGSLVLAFSPIYFALSYTFMTDVPFTAVATASSWLLLRGLRRDSWFEMGGGLILAAVAILIRQVGLAIPIAFAASYLVKYGFSTRRLTEAMFPVVTGFALQVAYEGWLRWSDRLPANFGKPIDTIRVQLIQLHQGWPSTLGDATRITSSSLVYLGFFLFPFLVAVYQSASPRRALTVLFALNGTAAATTAILTVYGKADASSWQRSYQRGHRSH